MRPPDIDATFVPRRTESAFTVELDGEAVILDEARNRLHHLNRTAALAWACFDGSGTIAEIARDLARAHGTSTARATADLVALTQDLATEGLLADVAAPPSDDGA